MKKHDEAQHAPEASMTTVSAERLAKIFVEVADTLVDDFDLLDFLHMLTVRTASLVGASAPGSTRCTPSRCGSAGK
jgi:hypothetical protein